MQQEMQTHTGQTEIGSSKAALPQRPSAGTEVNRQALGFLNRMVSAVMELCDPSAAQLRQLEQWHSAASEWVQRAERQEEELARLSQALYSSGSARFLEGEASGLADVCLEIRSTLEHHVRLWQPVVSDVASQLGPARAAGWSERAHILNNLRAGSLTHPGTGDPVRNWVVLVFELSPPFRIMNRSTHVAELIAAVNKMVVAQSSTSGVRRMLKDEQGAQPAALIRKLPEMLRAEVTRLSGKTFQHTSPVLTCQSGEFSTAVEALAREVNCRAQQIDSAAYRFAQLHKRLLSICVDKEREEAALRTLFDMCAADDRRPSSEGVPQATTRKERLAEVWESAQQPVRWFCGKKQADVRNALAELIASDESALAQWHSACSVDDGFCVEEARAAGANLNGIQRTALEGFASCLEAYEFMERIVLIGEQAAELVQIVARQGLPDDKAKEVALRLGLLVSEALDRWLAETPKHPLPPTTEFDELDDVLVAQRGFRELSSPDDKLRSLLRRWMMRSS